MTHCQTFPIPNPKVFFAVFKVEEESCKLRSTSPATCKPRGVLIVNNNHRSAFRSHADLLLRNLVLPFVTRIALRWNKY